MTETYIPSEPKLVLVPKNAFDEKSRNPLGEVFRNAGFERVGKWNRKDEVVEDGYRFRGIKGADALASQLKMYSRTPLANIFGQDVFLEALLQARRGTRSSIQILDTGIGTCSLRFLVSQQEEQILSLSDLDRYTIYTKYPEIVRQFVRGQIIRTEGADTRLSEAIERSEGDVAAFEIVGSGETARQLGLRVLDISGFSGKWKSIDFTRITTAMSIVSALDPRNLETRMTENYRRAMLELGLALESALPKERRATFRFNVPTDRIEGFREWGMKGPTVSPVMTRDGQKWSAVEITVPWEERNSRRVEIMSGGGEDVIMEEEQSVGISPANSQVWQALSEQGIQNAII
jgi:ATP phosphoribosyltransferase